MSNSPNIEPTDWHRGDFLKLSTTAVLGLALARLPAIAGPFTREDFDHLVPADKKLSPNWGKSLFARGTPEVLRDGKLKYVGMSVGGIGAGQLYLGGDGRLWHWDIFNKFIFTGAEHYAKPLVLGSPLLQKFSLKLGDKVVSLDRDGFSDVDFRGGYPIGFVNYADANVPLAVQQEAVSPFIPLSTDDSSLPATVFQFTVRNTSAATVEATLAGEPENGVCLHHRQCSGSFNQKMADGKFTAEIAVSWGRLKLQSVAFQDAAASRVQIKLSGKTVASRLQRDGKRVLLALNPPVEISAGEKLEITLA